MKRILLSAAVVSMFTAVNAQQDPQYSNFMYDRLSVNPAAAGMGDMYCGTVMYRNQWMGFEGAPKTILFNMEAPVSQLHGGVGLSFFHDKLGFETNNVLRLAYSYRLRLPGGHRLGIGASAGYAGKSLNASWTQVDQNDGSVPFEQSQDGAMDVGAGVFFQDVTGSWYAGLSTTHINAANLSNINLDVARHFWLMGGYKHAIKGTAWSLAGDALIKSDLASTQFDVAARAWFKGTVYGGVSYRHQDAVFPMVGVHLPIFEHQTRSRCDAMYLTAGMAYDVPISGLRDYNSGSIDLFVKVCYKPCRKSYLPPVSDVRFLGS